MKPIFENDLKKRTVEEAIETIRDRVDALGVSEPLIQEYGLGADQILVELPGVSDLDQVKTVIRSTARLEIHAVDGGPFPSQDAALQSVNGALPPDEEILETSGELAGSTGTEYYILDRDLDRGRQRLSLRRAGREFKHRAKNGEFYSHRRSRRQVLELHQRQCRQVHGRR